MGGECAEKIHLILRADLVVGVEHQLLRMGREGISESQNRVVWGGSLWGDNRESGIMARNRGQVERGREHNGPLFALYVQHKSGVHLSPPSFFSSWLNFSIIKSFFEQSLDSSAKDMVGAAPKVGTPKSMDASICKQIRKSIRKLL